MSPWPTNSPYQSQEDGTIPLHVWVNEEAGVEMGANDRLVLAYTSRSALCLRAQGIGLPDLRKQLEEEDEVLFGFLRFRRRGIVLQYTNPDCSRVVKGINPYRSQPLHLMLSSCPVTSLV